MPPMPELRPFAHTMPGLYSWWVGCKATDQHTTSLHWWPEFNLTQVEFCTLRKLQSRVTVPFPTIGDALRFIDKLA